MNKKFFKSFITAFLVISMTFSETSFLFAQNLEQNNSTENDTSAEFEEPVTETSSQDENYTSESTEQSSETSSETSSEIIETPESTEQQEESVVTPVLKSFDIIVDDFGKITLCQTSQNTDKILIQYSLDEKFLNPKSLEISPSDTETKITLTDYWKTYYFKAVPYNEETAGAPITIKSDIWEKYKPASAKIKNNKIEYLEKYNNLEIEVLDKSGNKIAKDYYSVSIPTLKEIGKHYATINFKGTYSGNPSIETEYFVVPKVPKNTSYSDITKTSISVSVSMHDIGTQYDYCEIKYSKNKDMSNSKTIKYTDTQFRDKVIKNLSKNTTYYLELRYVKTVKEEGKTYKSEPFTRIFKTAGDAPSLSKTNATTKAFINNLKKNKTFTLNFKCLVPISEAHKYINNIMEVRPQYDKFTRSYHYKSGLVESVDFKYNSSKASEANKLRKKIDNIVKGAKKKKGVRAKVKYVNKRMCDTSKYYWAAYRAHRKGKDMLKYPHAFDAYGCLVLHRSVCAGYAEAFAAIMTELDIPVKTVSTKTHAWNKVKVGNKWLHVDVTWNDCSKNKTKYLLKKSHK